jgi:uncharacterized protein
MEWLLIFVGGLLGSGHCIGMCGGFVLTLGSQSLSWHNNALRQIVYALGRISVYTLAGAMVGFGIWRMERTPFSIVNLQAILSLVAGGMLILEGIFSAGLLRRPFAASGGCPGANLYATMLRAPNLSSVFVAGLVNGLLPCGLVYAYLLLAASSGNLFSGAAVMGLFGLGTLPAMMLTGLAGSLLSLSWRRRIVHLAAWCMILTGVISIWRGITAFDLGGDAGPSCPYCTTGG